jgi:hypothetical protein
MRNIFTKHPNKVGESYFQHFIKASGISISLFFLALRIFIHALFPFFFEYSTSNKIKKLNDELQERKNKLN